MVMCTTCGVGPSWKRHSVGMGVSWVLELVGGGLYIKGGGGGKWSGWDRVRGKGEGRTLEPGVIPWHETGVDESYGAGT